MVDYHGKFVWYELMTGDPDGAEVFYRSVVGWEIRDASQPGMKYATFLHGEITVAGVMGLPEGARPGWIGYIAVSDVDAYAAKVAAAGGAIHRPGMDIPGIGRFAIVGDPQGAVVALFRGLGDMPPPPSPMSQSGFVGWCELMAADGATALDFYSDMFGWKAGDTHDMGPMGLYRLFSTVGEGVGGMMTKLPIMPQPFWTYYFRVDGIAAAVPRITTGGGSVINGPHQVPGGNWIVQGMDPQGVMFALVSDDA